MSEELKPCPFCGGEAKVWHCSDLDIRNYLVICEDCGACTKYTDSEDLCIEAWNRRVNDGQG